MNRLIRTQLIVFIVIAAVGAGLCGGNYVDCPLFGIGPSGLWTCLTPAGLPNAAVNYRGTPVGRVGEMTLRAGPPFTSTSIPGA